jgi:hypothetical protein
MKNMKLIKTIPMILLLIIIGIFFISISNKKSSLNVFSSTKKKVLCSNSICINYNIDKECIVIPKRIYHLSIEKDSNNVDVVTLTQTNKDCRD